MPTIFVIIIGMKRLAQPNQVLSDDVIIWSVFTKMTDSAILNSFVVSYEAETIKKLLVMPTNGILAKTIFGMCYRQN